MRAPLLWPLAFLTAISFGSAADTGGDAAVRNVEHGREVFQQNCALCHGVSGEATGQGPSLSGIVGRRAAALPDFGYTPALEKSGLTWDAAKLEKFLADPGALVPGTNMMVALPNADDRRDVVAFLATLQAAKDKGAIAGVSVDGRSAGDWQNDAPGKRHRIDLGHLPAPYATKSAGNGPKVVDRPASAKLSVPAGFEVKLFASGLSGPRLMRTAPNGDVFIAESRAGTIRVLRAPDGAEAPTENSIFAKGLRGPFGIAFYPAENPRWVYVGNNNSVVRFPYRTGDLEATGPAETMVAKLAETTGGHVTRDVVFSADGRRMFISVGSGSNVGDTMGRKSADEIRAWEKEHGLGAAWGNEANRADVLVADPEGRGLKIFATGIRNAVGLAVQPGTGALWCSVNERDGLGDDLVPDYISQIDEGAFYGWPWFYFGHEDPRHAGARPDLAGKARIPDVAVQAHSASLQLTFYPLDVTGAAAFPQDYRGDVFAALHGSWNRHGRTGSKVIRVHLENGRANGEYEDFLTGFVIDDGHVWGRPVGVTVAHDGALLVSEDGNGTLWRITPTGGGSDATK